MMKNMKFLMNQKEKLVTLTISALIVLASVIAILVIVISMGREEIGPQSQQQKSPDVAIREAKVMSYFTQPKKANLEGWYALGCHAFHLTVENRMEFVGGLGVFVSSLTDWQGARGHCQKYSIVSPVNSDFIKRNGKKVEVFEHIKYKLKDYTDFSTFAVYQSTTSDDFFIVMPSSESYYSEDFPAFYGFLVAKFIEVYGARYNFRKRGISPILHAHSSHMGVINAFKNSLEERMGVAVQTLLTVHDVSYEFYDNPIDIGLLWYYISEGNVKDLGIKVDKFNFATNETEKTIFVSSVALNGIFNGQIQVKETYFKQLQKLKSQNKVLAIDNGVSMHANNIFTSKNLKANNLTLELPKDGERWIPDLSAKKELARKLLIDKNILPPLAANLSLPIVLYVGRLDWVKGVDILRASGAPLLELGAIPVLLSKTIDLADEACATFVCVPQGQISSEDAAAVRFVADYGYMTSRSEAFGIAAVEHLMNGAPAVTSGVEGLKGVAIPRNESNFQMFRNYNSTNLTSLASDSFLPSPPSLKPKSRYSSLNSSDNCESANDVFEELDDIENLLENAGFRSEANTYTGYSFDYLRDEPLDQVVSHVRTVFAQVIQDYTLLRQNRELHNFHRMTMVRKSFAFSWHAKGGSLDQYEDVYASVVYASMNETTSVTNSSNKNATSIHLNSTITNLQ